jgi:hypothetical protein
MVGLAKLSNSQLLSSHFQYMLCTFSSHPFYPKYVHLLTADDPVSPIICENSKFWPYFKDVLGALDGSHIHSSPPLNECAASQNHKGFLSQSLFGCSFEFQFM